MSKVSPAVIQLAGEIARQMSEDGFFNRVPHTPAEHKQLIDAAVKLISAALSEREEKVKELIEASGVVVDWFGDESRLCREAHKRLRAALSALGELK